MGVGAQEKDFYFQPGLPVGYCLSVVGFGLSVVSGGGSCLLLVVRC